MEALRADEGESDLSDFHELRQGFIPHRTPSHPALEDAKEIEV